MRLEFSDPFHSGGVWLRGNLHTHSTASDGIHTPQEVIDLYGSKGYDFLSITDHGRVTDPSPLDPKGLVLIPGQEISVGRSEAGTTFHIVGVGFMESLPMRDFDLNGDPQLAIDAIRSRGGVAILAHPYWSGLNHSDMTRLTGYHGVEIYNSNCEIYNGAGDSRPHVDGLLAGGRQTLVLATDDHHGTPAPMKPLDACISWIAVKAEEPTPEAILSSITSGLFYASNGPEIKEINIEGGVIAARTSPVKSIGFIAAPSLGSKIWATEGTISEATHAIRRGEVYVRVEATDENGRTAWSNPIYVSEK